MHRETENTVFARAAAKSKIRRLLAQNGDFRVVKDCRAHLAEMKVSPDYIPSRLSIEAMKRIRK